MALLMPTLCQRKKSFGEPEAEVVNPTYMVEMLGSQR